jgi:hypothetical protein
MRVMPAFLPTKPIAIGLLPVADAETAYLRTGSAAVNGPFEYHRSPIGTLSVAPGVPGHHADRPRCGQSVLNHFKLI